MYIIRFIGRELRPTRTDIKCTGTTKVLGGLEDLGFLPIIEGYLFDVIHRELIEVHRSVLRVAYFDTVVEHAQMVRTHGPYIDGLESAYSTVVFELYPCKIAYGVRHRIRTESFQTCAF